MKRKTIIALTTAILAIPAFVIAQNTRFSDPDTVVKQEFWGNLYAEGGTTFFCEKGFSKKGFLLTDGYVYPLSEVRRALDCGTSNQCMSDSRYRQIASDLHNMVPVISRVEMSRRNSRYEEVGSTQPDDCGIRSSAQYFEPPEKVKGDIARTVAYMVHSYDLPWAGATRVFLDWNEMDPPDDTELTRHSQIAQIQGNENPFVLNPRKVETLIR